jgi:2-aminoethylphosphonate-pyruvate transaminase
VTGFAFVIARVEAIQTCKDKSHSLCLDLYDQWLAMNKSGKWRYTSPTHVVRAFRQALDELDAEGGVQKRNERYSQNHAELVSGMAALGFKTLLPSSLQSPIITSFLYPNIDFDFGSFYYAVKKRGFVLYPGKISQADTFRIGNLGEVYPSDINRLISAIGEVL